MRKGLHIMRSRIGLKVGVAVGAGLLVGGGLAGPALAAPLRDGARVTAAVVATAVLCNPAGGGDFNCTVPGPSEESVTSGDQTDGTEWTVPNGVHVLVVDAIGAWGGEVGRFSGGAPAELKASLMVGAGEQVWFAVGGAGESGSDGHTSTAGGVNGGGSSACRATYEDFFGEGGGGASDVRFGNPSLGARVLVAAGGGGAGPLASGGDHDAGGEPPFFLSPGVSGGSGHVADNGGSESVNYTSAGNGSFGQGGPGTDVLQFTTYCGGGGGGGYGGGGGGDEGGAGGGGSSYLNYQTFASPGTPAPLTTAMTPAGSDGSITFTYQS